MRIKRIKDTTGGLSLRDSELLADNQFESLKNFYYDSDKRLRTRRGYKLYFDNVPASVVVVDECNATAGWGVSDDATTLATGSAIRGTNSVSFDIDVSNSANDYATLTNLSYSMTIVDNKGYLGFWLYVPASFNTNLTNVKLKFGTDASNYYEWTLGTLTEGASNFIKLDYADATSTGTLNDASITYFELTVNYAASYTDKGGVRIDSIYSYSENYTEPIQGYFFVQDYNSGTKTTLVTAGENTFILSNTHWEVIDTGLTKYETAEGKTTHRTRWDYFAYNGSGTLEIGMCNGVDEYRKWNGTKITTFAGQPKYRYFTVLLDRIFASIGDITLYYTNAAVANIDALNGNDVDVGTEMDGNINGLFNLGQVILAGKTEKIYYVDVDNTIALPIDAHGGMFSHRVTANVGNAIFIENKAGIDRLKQRDGVTGGQAVEGKSYSDDLQDRLSLITDNQRNANCGYSYKAIDNYYFSFDTGDDNKPDTTFVYSSLVQAWTEYTYPAIYQYGYYVTSDNEFIHLSCSANSGQIYQIETGFDDDGAGIDYEFITKEQNMDNLASWKDYQSVDIVGLKNKGSSITIEVYVEGDIVYTADIDDTKIEDASTSVTTVGENPIGENAIGGGSTSISTSGIDLYRYRVRLAGSLFSSGRTIKIKGTVSDSPIVFTLDRYEIVYDDNTIDIIPTSSYA